MTQEELALLRELQPVIRKNMSCMENGDRFHTIDDFGGRLFVYYDMGKLLDSDTWIPDAISRDSSRPERGLWGMMGWNNARIIELFPSGNVCMQVSGLVITDTPYLALLKALKWQTELLKIMCDQYRG